MRSRPEPRKVRASILTTVMTWVLIASSVPRVSLAGAPPPLDGHWRVAALVFHGSRFDVSEPVEATVSGQKFEIYQGDGDQRKLVSKYHIALGVGGDRNINLIPRPIPPYTGRSLTEDEKRYASTGFKGIYRLTGDSVEIYFPMISTDPRPQRIPSDGGKGHSLIRMKRVAGKEKEKVKEKMKEKVTATKSGR